MKKVMIELEDGRIYSIPVKVIAANRADYYVKNDKDTTWDEEFNFVMSDDDEAIDWLFNNMNWYEHNPKLEEEGQMPDLSEATVEDTYVSEK